LFPNGKGPFFPALFDMNRPAEDTATSESKSNETWNVLFYNVLFLLFFTNHCLQKRYRLALRIFRVFMFLPQHRLACPVKIHPHTSIPQRYQISRARIHGDFKFSRTGVALRPGLTPEQCRSLLRFLDRIEATALLILAEDFPTE
jgi:hypothetical protein